MSAVPVARCGDHLDNGLQAAAVLMEALEIVSGGAVHEQDVGLHAVRDEVEGAVIGGDAEIEERVGKPELVFERGEIALLLASHRGGNGIEGVEADVCVVGAVIEKAGVENVLGGDVVLEAEESVCRPVFPSVGAGGQFFDDSKSVLEADRIGKPEAAVLDGAGEIESWVPVPEVEAMVNINAGCGIGGTEAPAVVTIRGFEAEDVCAGMGVRGTEAAGLDFGGARGIDVEAGSELAIHGIADFEAVEEVLRFSRAGAGNVQIVEIVLGDLGQSGEALGEDMGAGYGNVADGAGSERVALGCILRIDLIGGGGDLYLLVNFFGVI